MASVLDAARTLFAEHGPDQVSLRDVAKQADVSHSLIHRHFGSKDSLLRAVLHGEAQAFSESLTDSASATEATSMLFTENARRVPFMRILAYSLLSGVAVDDLYSEAGALAPLLERVRADPDEPTGTEPAMDPRVAVAAISAFTKGWLLFEPWVLHAVGADDDRDAAREQVIRLLQHILDLVERESAPAERDERR